MKLNCSLVSNLKHALAAGVLGTLAACGGGSDTQPEMAGGRSPRRPTQTSASGVSSAAPVAAGAIRMHFHRTQHDESPWGVYSWDGPLNPSPGCGTPDIPNAAANASAQRRGVGGGRRRLNTTRPRQSRL